MPLAELRGQEQAALVVQPGGVRPEEHGAHLPCRPDQAPRLLWFAPTLLHHHPHRHPVRHDFLESVSLFLQVTCGGAKVVGTFRSRRSAVQSSHGDDAGRRALVRRSVRCPGTDRRRTASRTSPTGHETAYVLSRWRDVGEVGARSGRAQRGAPESTEGQPVQGRYEDQDGGPHGAVRDRRWSAGHRDARAGGRPARAAPRPRSEGLLSLPAGSPAS